ncbi:MAG: glycosyltransferase [Candidatus Woesearchaeota archaeon]
MEKKQILIVAPPFIPVSKDSVAGIEQMAYSLGRALTEKGHYVYTIARDDSYVYGNLYAGGFYNMHAFPGAELEHFHQSMAYTTSVVRDCIKNQSIEVIIDKCQGVSLMAGLEEQDRIQERGIKVISALHMAPKYYIHPRLFKLIKPALEESHLSSFVAVSNHIAEKYIKELGINQENMHVVHNGIITENFSFSDNHQDYLLFLGRVRKAKAPHLAIKAAKDSGNRIVIAGGNIPGTNDAQYEDRAYFEHEIEPLLSKDVEWFGPADLRQKVELMKNAKALLFTSIETEAFPLTPLEAMACGTPVVAFRQSKGPKESIIDGETGFLADSYDELVHGIGDIGKIDRKKCREHVEKHFNYKRMAEGFEKLF